jgi:hypothetical protein
VRKIHGSRNGGELMQQRLRLLPGCVCLWVFFHLRRAGGLSLSFGALDILLLISWLVATPWLMTKSQLLHVKQHRNSAMAHVQQSGRLYQDYLNYGAGFVSLVFDDQLFDGFASFCVQLVVQIVGLIVAIPVGVIGCLAHDLSVFRH